LFLSTDLQNPPEVVSSVSAQSDCTFVSFRAVHLLPNRFLGVIGDHDGLPVEKIRASFDGKFIGSISHDSIVK